MFLRLKFVFLALITIATFTLAVGQNAAPAGGSSSEKPDQSSKKSPKSSKKGRFENVTPEQVVESTILLYAIPGGRNTMAQIRRTSSERGKITLTAPDGSISTANYQKWTMRGETLGKEKIRLDQEFPNAKFALVHADERIFGIFQDSVFEPRADAKKTFENQIYRGLDGLLRYKENQSKLALAGREKYMGVEYYLVDVTDKEGRTTRYYISVKTLRVMMIQYEENGEKYRRKFYDYNYAQGILVPYITALWIDDKLREETSIGTITFGQKVDEGLFAAK